MLPLKTKIITISLSLFIILSSLYTTYRISLNNLSDVVFMCSVYTAILTFIYFFYFVKLEEGLIVTQIKKIVSDFFAILNENNIKINKKIDNDIDDTDEDKKILKENKKIRLEALVIACVVLVVGLVLSFFIWKKTKKNSFKKYRKLIIGKNLIIIFFVVLIQFLFAKYITSKYLPLRTDEILNKILEIFFNLDLSKDIEENIENKIPNHI